MKKIAILPLAIMGCKGNDNLFIYSYEKIVVGIIREKYKLLNLEINFNVWYYLQKQINNLHF